MIYIVSNLITKEDQDRIKFILSLEPLLIKEWQIKFVDISSSELPAFDTHAEIGAAYFCMGNTFLKLAGRLREDKVYTAVKMIKGQIVDPDKKFVAYSFTKSIKESAYSHCTNEDKMELWDALNKFIGDVKTVGVFKDSDALSVLSEEVSEIKKDPLEEEFDNEIKMESSASPSRTEEQKHPNDEQKSYIEIDVVKVLNEIVSNIKMSDTGLGKSLNGIEKAVIETKDGILNIYPGNVIKSSDPGVHISYKDMCHLVKAAIVLGADNIKIFPRSE